MLPDRAAMCDATFDATAAATLDAAFLARLFPLLPDTSWERNEAFASPPVASSGHLDPEARARAGAATDSEDTVCFPWWMRCWRGVVPWHLCCWFILHASLI